MRKLLLLVLAAVSVVGCGGGGGIFDGGNDQDRFAGFWDGWVRVQDFDQERMQLDIDNNGRIRGQEQVLIDGQRRTFTITGTVQSDGDFSMTSRNSSYPNAEVIYRGDMTRSGDRLTGRGTSEDIDGNRLNFQFDLQREFGGFAPETTQQTGEVKSTGARYAK